MILFQILTDKKEVVKLYGTLNIFGKAIPFSNKTDFDEAFKFFSTLVLKDPATGQERKVELMKQGESNSYYTNPRLAPFGYAWRGNTLLSAYEQVGGNKKSYVEFSMDERWGRQVVYQLHPPEASEKPKTEIAKKADKQEDQTMVKTIEPVKKQPPPREGFMQENKKQFSGYWIDEGRDTYNGTLSRIYPGHGDYVKKSEVIKKGKGTITFKLERTKPETWPAKQMVQNPSKGDYWQDMLRKEHNYSTLLALYDMHAKQPLGGYELRFEFLNLHKEWNTPSNKYNYVIGPGETLFTLVQKFGNTFKDNDMTQAIVDDIVRCVPVEKFQRKGHMGTDKNELAKTLTPNQLRGIFEYYTYNVK